MHKVAQQFELWNSNRRWKLEAAFAPPELVLLPTENVRDITVLMRLA